MQMQILQSEKVENRRIKCTKMWITMEKPQKHGLLSVENPVDAVDSTQFGHKFISNYFLYISLIKPYEKQTGNRIKDAENSAGSDR